eukprot:scaffold1202_cov384-Prasinococcus_capsulatus_cf.AAC.17
MKYAPTKPPVGSAPWRATSATRGVDRGGALPTRTPAAMQQCHPSLPFGDAQRPLPCGIAGCARRRRGDDPVSAWQTPPRRWRMFAPRRSRCDVVGQPLTGRHSPSGRPGAGAIHT